MGVRKQQHLPIQDLWLSQEPDPRQALTKGKVMARAWAESIDPTDRLTAANAFTADTIVAYAADAGAGENLTSPPASLTPYALDDTARSLAATLGTAAARLDPLDAGYLISVVYTAMLPEAFRSRYGVYYTPPALTRRLIELATEAGVDWKTCRVLDPACGGGAFLAPAALHIIQELPACEPALLIQNIGNRLRGLEIDPFAAWMSQAFLEIALAGLCRAAGRRLPQLVRVCDSLAQEPTGPGYDLVIGNPPYGRIGLSPELRHRYRRSLYGHSNQYGVFTDLALRWAAPHGVIAYVTPTSFLAGEYFKALRALLANQAPPAAVDFLAARKGIFEDVLQETLLATYRKGGATNTAKVHYIQVDAAGAARIAAAGDFNLPEDPSKPWLLPREPAHAPLIERMSRMPTRLRDWGYKVSTGPLVWNRHKDQLRSRRSKNAYPLIWAEAIAGPGRFVFRAQKRNHQPYFALGPRDRWLTIDKPCVLLQRTTAKEQSRRLIAAELPRDFIDEHGLVVVENHLNMIRPLDGTPKVSPAVVSALLNSGIVDRAFRCISGSVAVSAYELEALPLPTLEQTAALEALLTAGTSPEDLDAAIQALYLGEAS